MAQTPEGKVKTWLRSKMKEYYPEAVHYCPPGGFFGTTGFPDDVWVIAAGPFTVFVCIESKAEGRAPTPLQMKRLLDLKRNGAVSAAMIGRDVDKLMKIKSEIDRRISFLSMMGEPFK